MIVRIQSRAPFSFPLFVWILHIRNLTRIDMTHERANRDFEVCVTDGPNRQHLESGNRGRHLRKTMKVELTSHLTVNVISAGIYLRSIGLLVIEVDDEHRIIIL